MNTMKRTLAASLLIGIASLGASAETMYDWTTSGSYAVGKTATFTMPEEGEAYYKLSGLKVGNEYTFVANGIDASVDVVYTYSEDGDTWDDTLAQSSPDMKTEDQSRCIVYYDDWTSAWIVIEDPDDKDMKVTPKGYFLKVSGAEGASVRVTSQTGAAEEPIPVGDIDKPKEISPATTPKTEKASYEDGAYYFTVKSAKQGLYLLTTSLGTSDVPVVLLMDSGTATYTLTDVSSEVATAGNQALLVAVTKAGTLNFHVAGGGASFALTHQYASVGVLGKLTVNTKGTDGTWYIKGVTGTKYESGDTIGILGEQTVCFDKVTGFSTPANMVATPTEEEPNVILTGVYNDTYDPKDDALSGKVGSVTYAPTKITPSAKVQTAPRTLFEEDPADHFSFTAKDGVYYNFGLDDLEGDAVMTIFAKAAPTIVLAGPATKIAQFAPGKGDFIIQVAHSSEEEVDASYALAYNSANVGAISFAKTAVSAKKSAGSVTLTVNRSSGEGKVRVLYGTVNDSAQPGVDYYAQNGELVWENGDKKAKTITIRLIPEAFAEEAISRQFSVQLKAIDEEELGEDEYLASITSGKDEAVVTVTETMGKTPTPTKAATVKTESVPLESGTYQGVIAEDGSALTNGFPALASVTFTAKDTTKMKTVTKALSAKVILGGKTYTFAADDWDEDETSDTTAVAILTQTLTVNKVKYENALRVEVARGATDEDGDWTNAIAKVALTMNVPDSNNKGVQEDVAYAGELYRDNSKIQDYLHAVTNGVGYYTVALAPSGVLPGDGIPAGNGYLTLTLDNKGKAKVAGMLADGTTKPSYSSIVAVKDDGDTLLIPVFVAKSPYCFGGTLKLVRGEDGKYVVDSSESLIWNNDNALLTYDGEEGWKITLDPVGGYFNTVDNLQAHYLTHDLSVSTVETGDLLEESLASGYEYVTDAQPNGLKVSLTSNTLSTDKKSIVKDGKLVDFEASVNPCNVQVKLTRATGLVTGSFSVWTENEAGTAQKEITGLKHYGILLFSRNENAPLDADILTAGFFTQTATLRYEVTSGTKTVTKTRKYTASNPFNVIAVDQGEPDWYADDWGDRPEE